MAPGDTFWKDKFHLSENAVLPDNPLKFNHLKRIYDQWKIVQPYSQLVTNSGKAQDITLEWNYTFKLMKDWNVAHTFNEMQPFPVYWIVVYPFSPYSGSAAEAYKYFLVRTMYYTDS